MSISISHQLTSKTFIVQGPDLLYVCSFIFSIIFNHRKVLVGQRTSYMIYFDPCFWFLAMSSKRWRNKKLNFKTPKMRFPDNFFSRYDSGHFLELIASFIRVTLWHKNRGKNKGVRKISQNELLRFLCLVSLEPIL